MLRVAAEDGTRAILATPHSKDVQEASAHRQVLDSIETLRSQAKAAGIDIDILLGMENHVTPDLPLLVEKGVGYPINGHGYILVELPFHSYPDYVDDVLSELLFNGYKPIVAHPERQESIQRDLSIMERLVERGIMGQVTSTSITGRFGPDVSGFARALMEQDLVHLIASDCHRPTGPRSPAMSAAVEEASRIVGADRATAMSVSIPQAILEGRPVEMGLPAKKNS